MTGLQKNGFILTQKMEDNGQVKNTLPCNELLTATANDRTSYCSLGGDATCLLGRRI